MSTTTFNSASLVTLLASEDIPFGARVVEFNDSGTLKAKLAGVDELADAIAQGAVSEGDHGMFKFVSSGDTNYGIANGEVTLGGFVYAAADGKLAATGTVIEGYARQSEDGEIFEWRSKPAASDET